MNYRYMRVIVFFDLPVIEPAQKRAYTQFRKFLVQDGFFMMQESVYCKLLTTSSVETSAKNLIWSNRPPNGLVQTLIVTEKQYAKMEFIVGESKNDIVDNPNRLVII